MTLYLLWQKYWYGKGSGNGRRTGKTTKGINIDNTRFREFLLNIEFCKATVIYRTCTMPTILKLHFYQCLKSIVLSTWLLIHVLLQKFHLLYLVKNGNCICIKKCPFKFWTCSNLIIFLLYLGVYFSAFSNFVRKTLHFSFMISFMISGNRFNLVLPPPLHPSKKKTSKFASTVLVYHAFESRF